MRTFLGYTDLQQPITPYYYADNVAVTAGSGTTIAADEVTDATLGSVKVQYVKLMDGTLDSTAKASVDATKGLTVNQGTLLAGEDLVNNKLVVEQRNSFATITTATTTTVKSGAGFIHAISIIGGTLGAITVYDNTAGSGTAILPTFTPTATLPCPTIHLDEAFATGLTIVTAAATIINISYR